MVGQTIAQQWVLINYSKLVEQHGWSLLWLRYFIKELYPRQA